MFGIVDIPPIRVDACAPAVSAVGAPTFTPIPPPTATPRLSLADKETKDQAEIPADFAAADTVFLGTATNVDHVSTLGYNFGVWERATLKVDTVWKGKAATQFDVVVTGEGFSDCDFAYGRRPEYSFTQGVKYVVYAHMGQYGLTATRGTKEAVSPALEVSVLGPGTNLIVPTVALPTVAPPVVASAVSSVPTVTPVLLTANERNRSATVIFIAIGVIVGVVGTVAGIFMMRRRRAA